MFCPAWIYDIAVARTASEFLSSDMTVEAFARKYSEALSANYREISVEALQEPAEAMLMFLAEIEKSGLKIKRPDNRKLTGEPDSYIIELRK